MKNQKYLKKHFLIFSGIAIVCIIIFSIMYNGLKIDPNAIKSPLLGNAAPNISFTSLKDPAKTHRLDEFWSEKPVILNFWASWCVSCKQEARQLELAHMQLSDKATVVGVAIQDEYDVAIQFAKRFGKTYLLGLDETGYANTDFGIRGVPETFIIDKTGTVVKHIVGPVEFAQLQQEIEKL